MVLLRQGPLVYTKGTMMSEAIKNFPQQFSFAPVVENAGALRPFTRVLICGMGGSHLAADLLPILTPGRRETVYSDYGLPELGEDDKAETILILSSYSGNTEEVIEAAHQAKTLGLNAAVIAVGGTLLQLAKDNNWPFVALPNTGVQPRSALGLATIGLLALLNETAALSEVQSFANFDGAHLQAQGQALAARLAGFVPVIYASHRNQALAYNWKIKFNETGKIPAFYNVIPELNHNEMNGYDYNAQTRALSERFRFIFLRDAADHPMNQKRFEVLAQLYADRGLPVEVIEITGATPTEKVFSNLLLADWTALGIAEQNGAEPEAVPMVEEFKHLIRV